MIRSSNINRSIVHEPMVQRICKSEASAQGKKLFPTIRELLCFCALLGYSEDRRVPLDEDAGVEDVSYQQFERGDAEDLIYLIALAATRDPELLKDGQEAKCAEIFEEYANGGLYIIGDWLRRGGDEYPDRAIIDGLKEMGYLDLKESPAELEGLSFDA